MAVSYSSEAIHHHLYFPSGDRRSHLRRPCASFRPLTAVVAAIAAAKVGLSRAGDYQPISTANTQNYLSDILNLNIKQFDLTGNCCDFPDDDDDWSRLLDPLDPSLRAEIIKYGELAQATYDAFDCDPESENCGNCMFDGSRFFDELGLGHHSYAVTRYLYATSHADLPPWLPRWLRRSLHADAWSRDSNWMGFVAVGPRRPRRRRDIVVAWRGTIVPAEWFEDLHRNLETLHPASVASAAHAGAAARVERGFQSMYTSRSHATPHNQLSASEQVMREIRRAVNYFKSKGEEVMLTVTGHSLGGALALLNAHEAASAIPDVPVRVISFGSPRVGNEAFGTELRKLNVKILRVVIKQDLVPKLPGIIMNERMRRWEAAAGALEWAYAHVGHELKLDVAASPYLKRDVDFAGYHGLETYLHLVDGYVGSNSGFRRGARRNLALVNKAGAMLRRELGVPACWYRPAAAAAAVSVAINSYEKGVVKDVEALCGEDEIVNNPRRVDR
ncbi:Phospholipase A1-Igamma1, chloroplastic [Ananas comosus]|uniref:Phospholipase A1-Igamma1, chloroplastic n=1 Tax=Ananas comosus TaxID=4615 RepID=A0A199VSH1_ANACO|nr:Phospholipase A1-Igamma1, chloroplastic [Ananas comosus]